LVVVDGRALRWYQPPWRFALSSGGPLTVASATMQTRGRDLEDVLDAILRGSAKILGCDSTHLILFNEKTNEIRIRVGAKATSYPVLDQLESLLGQRFDVITLSLDSAHGSLVYASWRDGAIRETSSLSELVANTFPPEVTEQLAAVIGEHRFICVPALSGTRNYGVLLFEKQGRHHFSRQQRAVLLRYARRIGEIVENNLVAQGQTLFAQPTYHGPTYLLFDPSGAVRGTSPDRDGHGLTLFGDEATLERVRARVRAFVAADAAQPGAAANGGSEQLDEEHRIELVPVSVDDEPGVLGILHQRSRQRTALESDLLQLTLGDPAPALFVDPRFCVTSCNEASELLFGYEAGELRGMPVGRLFRQEREILDLLSPQILDPEHPYFEEAAVIRRQDGTLRPARAQALLLADDVDQVDGYLVVVRPRSETREQPPDVQQRLATLGEMTAQLTHEIRNPLVAIGAALESLGQEQLSEDQQAVLGACAQEIARLDAVLQGYLAVRPDMALREVNVAEAVDGARRLLQAAHKMAGKTITANIDPALTVRADYDAFRRVLFNLLLNALEASAGDAEVVCRAEATDRQVSVIVEDRGPGLGANEAQCFQPFFTTKKNGTGLGLPVCQKIAQALGGLVELRNRREGGAQAAVILPRRALRPQGSRP
jgi:PAS domain S-box-containing protein